MISHNLAIDLGWGVVLNPGIEIVYLDCIDFMDFLVSPCRNGENQHKCFCGAGIGGQAKS